MQRLLPLMFATGLFAFFGCSGATPEPVVADDSLEEVTPAPQAPILRDRGIDHVKGRRDGAIVRVKELKVSAAVEVGTNKAIKPQPSFRSGIRKICASFYVSGLEEGGTIRVMWYEGENMTEENDIESEGEKRYSICIEKKKGIADGDYSLDVEVEGEVYGGRSFMVGGDSISPVIDRSLLGARLAKNKLPKKAATVFKSNTKSIHCGVRFLGLPEDAKISVEWTSMGEDGDEILHTSEKEVAKGGNANVGLTWKPDGKLNLGQYKAVVLLGSRKMDELPFEIE